MPSIPLLCPACRNRSDICWRQPDRSCSVCFMISQQAGTLRCCCCLALALYCSWPAWALPEIARYKAQEAVRLLDAAQKRNRARKTAECPRQRRTELAVHVCQAGLIREIGTLPRRRLQDEYCPQSAGAGFVTLAKAFLYSIGYTPTNFLKIFEK